MQKHVKHLSIKDGLLAAALFVSFCTTLTGFLDLMGFASESRFSKIAIAIVVSAIFTGLIQFSVLHWSREWWKTRAKGSLFLVILFAFISVIFGWGFYFTHLNIGSSLANQTYSNARSGMLNEAYSNKSTIDNLIEKTEGLVAHTQNMAAEEENNGGTCDALWRGYGERTAFRKRDANTLMAYQNQFTRISSNFNRVYYDISQDNLQKYSTNNVEALNIAAQKLNVITKDFGIGKTILLGWLAQRVRHNQPGWLEYYDDGIRAGRVRCPDEDIERYYKDLKAIEPFKEISLVDIPDPNESGAQVLQAFRALLHLIQGNFSWQEFWALMFAVAVDISIFILARRRLDTSPPSSIPSWGKYWTPAQYEELMNLSVVDCCKRLHLYIPVNRIHLITSMYPLIAEGKATITRKIAHWPESLRVPKHIRQQGDDSGFVHYIVRIDYGAAWFLDHKLSNLKQEKSTTDAEQPFLHNGNGSLHPEEPKPNSDSAIDPSPARLSLNGNSNKGVQDHV